MGQYLERYLAGECQPVWDELLALGGAVREEPLASEAWAVAQETMRRVRYNIELLISRLHTLGYRFGEVVDVKEGRDAWPRFYWPEDERYWPEHAIFQPPPPDTPRLLDELEQRVGLLPLSVRAFYLEIGEVNLVGILPTLDRRRVTYDPLLMSLLARLPEEETVDEQDEPVPGSTDLILSPDVFHKFDVSGGGPYFMTMPNASIDGVFHDDGWHEVHFVEYLRLCFRSGGLLDLEKSQQVEGVAEVLGYLREGLLPI